MKFFAILVLSTLAILAHAQPNSVGFIATRTSGSDTTGNSAALGGCVEVTHDTVTDLVILSGQACYNNGKKEYVGDGHNLGASGEAHIYFQHSAELRPYLIAGIGWSEQFNSQYSKGIINPFIGAGLNYRNRWFVEGTYLLPERGTANHISALRVRTYYIYPLASRWSAKFGGSLLNTKFTQPNGVAAGTHRAATFTVFGGFLWMRNEKAAPIEPPVLMRRPRYTDLPLKAQNYLDDFGSYRLTIPTL